MFDLSKELFNFSYREVEVQLTNLFPKLDLQAVHNTYAYLKETDPHTTIYAVARALWNHGYKAFLQEYGFWDSKYIEFTGHSHQCVPIMGAVLKALGFEVSFLEAQKIRNHFLNTGIIEPVPVQEETGAGKVEFMKIRRIPYSCLEVMIKGVPFYISPKHIKPSGNVSSALLTPECYQSFIGVFRHQDDASKSGIYLQNIIPKNNLAKANFSRRIVWFKQSLEDSEPEVFCTFLRMKLV